MRPEALLHANSLNATSRQIPCVSAGAQQGIQQSIRAAYATHTQEEEETPQSIRAAYAAHTQEEEETPQSIRATHAAHTQEATKLSVKPPPRVRKMLAALVAGAGLEVRRDCAATCVLILLCICPHTTACVHCMCPHTDRFVSAYYYICVLMLLYMCSYATVHVSSYYYVCPHTAMCPHTAISVSLYYLVHLPSYYCISVLILVVYTCVLILLYLCPHSPIYVSSYCYSCVLILLYNVSSYY